MAFARKVSMKTCPYCAETDLKDAAVACKHCGRDMPLPARERRIAFGVLAFVTAILVFGVGQAVYQWSNSDAKIVVGE
jgi:hypothetical protein